MSRSPRRGSRRKGEVVPQYFDPTRRTVALSPPPVVVKAMEPRPAPGGYFDPSRARVRNPFPDREELAAVLAALPREVALSLEGLKAPGESVLDNLWRRYGSVPRCEACGAVGGGDLGHRAGCRVAHEARYKRDHWWLGRRKASAEGMEWGEESDDLPF